MHFFSVFNRFCYNFNIFFPENSCQTLFQFLVSAHIAIVGQDLHGFGILDKDHQMILTVRVRGGLEQPLFRLPVILHGGKLYPQTLRHAADTSRSSDFMLDEETGQVAVTDRAPAVLGGMIAEKTIKYTRNNQVMAFVSLEDLVGSVEVVIFPRDYEQYSALLAEDAKLFIRGRVSVEEDKDAKLICEQIVSFDQAADGGPLFPGKGGRGGGGAWAPQQRRQSEQVPPVPCPSPPPGPFPRPT